LRQVLLRVLLQLRDVGHRERPHLLSTRSHLLLENGVPEIALQLTDFAVVFSLNLFLLLLHQLELLLQLLVPLL
jgi:hypothetical protein